MKTYTHPNGIQAKPLEHTDRYQINLISGNDWRDRIRQSILKHLPK